MGRIGSFPSVPEEYVGDVVSTSWSLATTNRDPKLVLRAEPGELATQCPSCHSRLLLDLVGTSGELESARWRKSLDAPVSSVMRHATQIAGEAPLSTAAELLRLSPRRLVAVVDAEHRPLGVLTSTRILTAVSKCPRDQLGEVSALDAATASGPLLPGRTRVEAALRVLAADDRDFVLVVDEAGALLGALLSTDVLHALARASGDKT